VVKGDVKLLQSVHDFFLQVSILCNLFV
jgi:hypothetical protein